MVCIQLPLWVNKMLLRMPSTMQRIPVVFFEGCTVMLEAPLNLREKLLYSFSFVAFSSSSLVRSFSVVAAALKGVLNSVSGLMVLVLASWPKLTDVAKIAKMSPAVRRVVWCFMTVFLNC